MCSYQLFFFLYVSALHSSNGKYLLVRKMIFLGVGWLVGLSNRLCGIFFKYYQLILGFFVDFASFCLYRFGSWNRGSDFFLTVNHPGCDCDDTPNNNEINTFYVMKNRQQAGQKSKTKEESTTTSSTVDSMQDLKKPI